MRKILFLIPVALLALLTVLLLLNSPAVVVPQRDQASSSVQPADQEIISALASREAVESPGAQEIFVTLVDEQTKSRLAGWLVSMAFQESGKRKEAMFDVPEKGISLTFPIGHVEMLAGALGHSTVPVSQHFLVPGDLINLVIPLPHLPPQYGTVRVKVAHDGMPVPGIGEMIAGTRSTEFGKTARRMEVNLALNGNAPPFLPIRFNRDEGLDPNSPEFSAEFLHKHLTASLINEIGEWETEAFSRRGTVFHGFGELKLLPGNYTLLAEIAGYSQGTAVFEIGAGEERDIELSVSPVSPIRGTVRLLSTPCPAKIRISCVGEKDQVMGIVYTETDENGNFLIPLPPDYGPAYIVFYTERDPFTGEDGICYSETIKVDPAHNPGELNIVLGNRIGAEFIVTDSQDRPVSGVKIKHGLLGPIGWTNINGYLKIIGDFSVTNRENPKLRIYLPEGCRVVRGFTVSDGETKEIAVK